MGATVASVPEGTRVEERTEDGGFSAFFAEAEPRLRRALVARLGAERGREATAEALAWGFEHWTEVAPMANGVGYLYRVGVSRTRARKPLEPARVAAQSRVEATAGATDAGLDPEVWAAVMALSDSQRVAVVLVHAYGWPMKEVAELLDVSVSTIGTHLHRGLQNLRRVLVDATTNDEVDDA